MVIVLENLTAALCLKNKIEKDNAEGSVTDLSVTDLRVPFDKNSQYSSINEFSEGQIFTRASEMVSPQLCT